MPTTRARRSAAASTAPLGFAVADGVATITLERPETRNALGAGAWAALGDALGRAAADASCRVLVVRGSGGAFASGADLKELATLVAEPAALRAWYRRLRDVLETLYALPLPTVAAIDGGCHGAGLSLAVACDLRVATSRSAFSAPPARLGLLYSGAELRRLAALVGPGRARDLLYTARTLAGAEAERLGLVERAVAADEFEATLATLLEPLRELSPYSIREHKRALVALGRGQAVDDGAAEAAFFGADAREGFAAFAARRRPRFMRREAG